MMTTNTILRTAARALIAVTLASGLVAQIVSSAVSQTPAGPATYQSSVSGSDDGGEPDRFGPAGPSFGI
jgi:hypothetical protein